MKKCKQGCKVQRYVNIKLIENKIFQTSHKLSQAQRISSSTQFHKQLNGFEIESNSTKIKPPNYDESSNGQSTTGWYRFR